LVHHSGVLGGGRAKVMIAKRKTKRNFFIFNLLIGNFVKNFGLYLGNVEGNKRTEQNFIIKLKLVFQKELKNLEELLSIPY